VMVWIHGGGLSMGAASQYEGAPLAAYENIVMVVIQYHLGILGFFSTGDHHAQGNWGFLGPKMGARKYRGLWWRSKNCHSGWRICRRRQCIYTDSVSTMMMGITNHEFGWILPQSFAPPGWESGMNRESVLSVANIFNPAGASAANSLIADQYLKDAGTPEEIRDAFTEMIGDMLMALPVVTVAGYLSERTARRTPERAEGGDFVSTEARGKLKRGIRDAKHDHKQRIEDHFANNNNPRSMWNGIKALTDYKSTNLLPSNDAELPDVLNQFFARFDTPGGESAPLIHPPAEETTLVLQRHQSFAPPGWESGMNRESVLSVANIFNPAGASAANSLIADQYLKDAGTPEEIRDAFTEMIGDMLMALPVVTVAGYLSDAGVPVYMYEFAYRAEIHKNNRPSFVKADHADDVGFVFGGCFWNGHLKIIGMLPSTSL
ncbi:Carboxylesterase 5A, partial [Dissostichus eleginoides]